MIKTVFLRVSTYNNVCPLRFFKKCRVLEARRVKIFFDLQKIIILAGDTVP